MIIGPQKNIYQSNPETLSGPSIYSQSEHVIANIELTFKDQFASRRDMWKVTQQLNNMTVYKTKQLEIGGIRVRFRALYNARHEEILNGIIDITKTRFAFFSKSSQIQILIEASSDMYSFDHNGMLNTEKAVMFVRSYFDRCLKQFGCTNEVSVVVYGRIYYPQVRNENQLKEELRKHYDVNPNSSFASHHINDQGAFLKSKHIKFFQDVYVKVGTYEISKMQQEKAVMAIKRALNYFPSLVNWSIGCPNHIKQLKELYPAKNFNRTSTTLYNGH